MTCEETQQAFSLYVDDGLALPIRVACDEHLRQCPTCRGHLAEVRSLTRDLAVLSRPVIPADLVPSISDALRIEAAARQRQPKLPLGTRIAQWLEPRLVPYTVSALASLILFVVMLGMLRLNIIALRNWEAASIEADNASIRILTLASDSTGREITEPVSAEDLAAHRAPYAVESPSLNPRGALAALTRSSSHRHADDDDMVVVADVFSNGSASLAGVVQPPRDRRMLNELQTALRQNPAFVPASFDRRPQTMRVVFVIQKVNVREQDF